jgi:hypothetical protein
MADTVTIYMPLANEGTDVWRPVTAERLGGERFRVLGPMSDDEEWVFAPGSVVIVAPKLFADGTCGVVAVALSTLIP